jgi:benzoyl-CoA reductase subunit B
MAANPVIEGLVKRVERAKRANAPLHVIARYEKQIDHLKEGLDPDRKGKHVVWAPGGGAPGAILECFKNLSHFNVTGYGYMAAVWGFASKYIDIADKAGFARDTCSSVRATLGVALSGEVPRPDLIMGASMWCENFRPWRYVAALWDVPIYEIDSPQPYYAPDKAVAYLVKEYERFVAFMEELTGQKMDWDELEWRVRNRLKGAEISREINDLRKAVPTPMKGRDAMRLYAGWDGAPGSDADEGGCGAAGAEASTSAALDGLIAIRDEVKATVERGEGPVPEERYRLIWCQTPPFYVDLTGYMEKEHGATCAFNDPHKHIWWKPGEYDGLPPLEVLARQQLGEPWGGSGTRRIDTLIENAKDYKADGVIFFKSWGCRVSGLHGRQLQERMMNEAGIPVLILDEDYMDVDNYSDEETKMRLDSFVEMMDQMKEMRE